MTDVWEEVRAWRRNRRQALLAQRAAIPPAERQRARAIVADLLADRVAKLNGGCIGFYWPIKGELDLRAFLRARVQRGDRAALPVVVAKNGPLEFWAWQPDMRLRRGEWNIPVPSARCPVTPTVLLVALLGFDAAGYRLGYGGGYYDRTLAALSPRPLTVGVGFECGRLPTIYPQPHDIRMDAIVTEEGFTWCDERAAEPVRRVRRTSRGQPQRGTHHDLMAAQPPGRTA